MFKNLSRRASLKLRSFLINLLSWIWLKPITLNIRIINFFTQYLAAAKNKILKDINIYELDTNSKLFLTTDNKRAPYGPQITKRADDSEDWKEYPAVKMEMLRAKERSEALQKIGEIGLIKRSNDELPKPMDGYMTVTKEDLGASLKNMVQQLKARGLVKEIQNGADNAILKEMEKEIKSEVGSDAIANLRKATFAIEKEIKPKRKKPAAKKKTNKKVVTKPASKKKKIRR